MLPKCLLTDQVQGHVGRMKRDGRRWFSTSTEYLLTKHYFLFSLPGTSHVPCALTSCHRRNQGQRAQVTCLSSHSMVRI